MSAWKIIVGDDQREELLDLIDLLKARRSRSEPLNWSADEVLARLRHFEDYLHPSKEIKLGGNIRGETTQT